MVAHGHAASAAPADGQALGDRQQADRSAERCIAVAYRDLNALTAAQGPCAGGRLLIEAADETKQALSGSAEPRICLAKMIV